MKYIPGTLYFYKTVTECVVLMTFDWESTVFLCELTLSLSSLLLKHILDKKITARGSKEAPSVHLFGN